MPALYDSRRPLLDPSDDDGDRAGVRWCGVVDREKLQDILSSKKTHYLILGLVALDVSALLGNVFLELVACDTDGGSMAWAGLLREGLTMAGLIFSSIFLLEFALCLAAFGLKYLTDWFHCLDGAVIIASFVIDLLSHGIVEDIASLVIIFRLFRFVKLVEEMSLGASVRMDNLTTELERLHGENAELKAELARRVEDLA